MDAKREITSETGPQPFSAYCPSREILELIGGKWSLLILCALKAGPMRTGSMMRTVEGISQKMLTQTLRALERSGLVERTSYPEVPPRVEYSLTPLGTTLSVLVLQFEHWVIDNYEQVITAQVLFDTLHSEEADVKV
jgi:DNA-binding HxlR family transcriptional regulator